MTPLRSLIVQREVATIEQVDLAHERQVAEGGDLLTCLLECVPVREEVLGPLLSEAFGLAAGPAGELPTPAPALLRMVPRAMAQRYRLYPLAEEGGELVVAVAEPLSATVEEDLAFALGVPIVQRVAPAFRVHEGLARAYGVPLEQRYAVLTQKLAQDSSPPAASSSSSPVETPLYGLPVIDGPGPLPPGGRDEQDIPFDPNPTPVRSPASVPPRRNTWRGIAAERQDEEAENAPPELAEEAPPELAEEAPPELAEEAPPELAEEAPPVPTPEPIAGPPAEHASEPPSSVRSGHAPPPEFIAEAMMATAAQVERKRRIRREAKPTGAGLLHWARRAAGEPVAGDRPAERRLGPMTPASAERAFEEAATPEEALGLFFDFAKQYFEYAALFVVHGDLAEGHSAWGPGASREKVRGVGIALNLPSTLSRVRTQKTPHLGSLREGGLDAALADDLGRTVGNQVLLMPVVVRGRTVAILYGDHGTENVEYAAVGDVIAVASLVTQAFERIVLRRKRVSTRLDSEPQRDVTTKLASPVPSGAPSIEPGPSTAPGPTSEIAMAPPSLHEAVTAKPPAVHEAPTAKPPTVVEGGPAIAPVATEVTAEPPQVSGDAAASVPPPRRRSSIPARRLARLSSIPPGFAAEVDMQWAAIADKRGLPKDDQLVDEGWELAPESLLAGATDSPAPADVRGDPGAADPAKPARRGFGDNPPPATVAAVRPLSGQPIAREEPDDPPELTVTEATEDVASLIGDVDPVPFPPRPVLGKRPSVVARMRPPAPESTRISVDPRHPPMSSRAPLRNLPPVVLHSDLVDKVVTGGGQGDRALGELLSLGEAAIPAVFSRFPGPLTVDRNQALATLPRAVDCGPVLRIVGAMRRLALPFLAVRSADSEVDVRFWATYLLGDLHYADSASALWPRLFDESQAVRRIALRSARSILTVDDAGQPLRVGLERLIAGVDEPEHRRQIAISIVVELKLYAILPSLIAALEDRSEAVASTALQALVTLARQDFGRDVKRWRDWWSSKAH